MRTKNILLMALFSASAMSFASNGLYTTVGKLEGIAVVGKETNFKIKYKWFTDQERTGKVFYTVAGTSCNGSVDIDKHAGALPVSGELNVKCIFDKSAQFKSDVVLQLYDGNVEKEISKHSGGNVTVTAV